MHKKHNVQRTVGIQSTEFHDADVESGFQTARLCKKTGFRNLLRHSVAIVSQENDERSEVLALPKERNSKSIQTSLGSSHYFQKFRRSTRDSTASSPTRDYDSRTLNSETVKMIDRAIGSANPGTSRMTSMALSSLSVASQTNEFIIRPNEGSVAVVYSYDGKVSENSRSSNLAYFYGSQGSRRFSDETVILIEDYQSYDFTNAARRQDLDLGRRRSTIICCNRSKRTSREVLSKPVPIECEEIQEKDESTVCRICHEGEDVEPLIQPCLCKGSVGNVHAKCLKIWLEQSNTSRCELCNYPYAIRQTKKYPKCLSVKVFFQTVVDRRALAYDIISFVIITPLTLLGVAMCIQASIFSGSSDSSSETSYQMGNITKAGMIMLSGTIVVAYGVWLYTLISYHFKSWKKWYSNCFDVEVLPVRMTSEERLEAARRLSEEVSRRQLSREQGSALLTVLQSTNPTSYSFYQRRMSATYVSSGIQFDW